MIIMGTKNDPGEFDCYGAADDDEPMFVLLARDPIAPRLVDAWATARYSNLQTDGSGREGAKIAEARACAKAMSEWRRNHP